MRRCPVRSLTAETKFGLEWFFMTHTVTSNGLSAQWSLLGLPQAGGIADQDAKLWETLRYLQTVHNELLDDDVKARAQAK